MRTCRRGLIVTSVGLIALALSGPAVSLDREAEPPAAAQENHRAKAVSTQTLGSRGTVTGSATLYGGFEIAGSTTVYILVRGNSLGSLGITQSYLDAPRVRIFDSQGQDLAFDVTGRGGFNACLASGAASAPVVAYYQNRGGVHERDACTSKALTAGVYTFSVTPSIPGVTTNSGTSSPGAGEVLFEVVLGPSAPAVETSRQKTERLLGGTWTFTYSIGSTSFTARYQLTSVQPLTSSPGDFLAIGTDEFGDPVGGGYITSSNLWGLLDQSIILDRFFTFNFSDLNHVSGCYYQLTPPGSTNLGTCYPMSGVRSPFKSAREDAQHAFDRDSAEVEAAKTNPLDGQPDIGSQQTLPILQRGMKQLP
jgi:hypothetical protein